MASLPGTDAAREAAIGYARAGRQRFLGELAEFIRFPSISVQPRHAPDILRCAGWLAEHLRRIGLENVELVKTLGHPIVTANWQHLPGACTLLIYGHYDVQPVDPLEEWQSPPFAPRIHDRRLFGRGASDDKGQLFAHLKALESYLRTIGSLPINVQCLFEGEEEIGSPHLTSALRQPILPVDVAILSDTPVLGPERPALVESLRGALSIEVELRGMAHDLHSGNFGGAIHNPLQALCELIARLHDRNGRIAIPGFYERVRELPAWERAYMACVGPSDRQLLRDAGVAHSWGETDFSLYERLTIRPALTVNGITGGYQGPGGKAVIPARASAKLNFRLVPDQEPTEIERLLRHYITQILPHTVQTTVHTQMSAHPVVLSRHIPAMKVAASAYQRGYGTPPAFLRLGGTIPVVHCLQRLGIPTVLMGFDLPDDDIHAPNESFFLPNFFHGIETCIHFLAELAALGETVHAQGNWL